MHIGFFFTRHESKRIKKTIYYIQSNPRQDLFQLFKTLFNYVLFEFLLIFYYNLFLNKITKSSNTVIFILKFGSKKKSDIF
jgi:hypothetical protein